MILFYCAFTGLTDGSTSKIMVVQEI